MKNIILQHYTGILGDLEVLSSTNMQKYASSIGADYYLIRGDQFYKGLRPPLQKLHMLHKEFDQYDNTVMVDIDGFARTEENIFTYTGIGQHNWIQEKLRSELAQKFPLWCSVKCPYWGGFIYKLSRDLRVRFREVLWKDPAVLQRHNPRNNKGDEGVMHSLATKLKMNEKNVYFNGYEWGHPGFWWEGMEQSKFIHVRDKIDVDSKGNGIKAPKIESYRKLNAMGIIE